MELPHVLIHAVCGVWDMRYGTISKFWDIVVCPFVSMFVGVYKVGRYKNFHVVPYQEYFVYFISFKKDKCAANTEVFPLVSVSKSISVIRRPPTPIV